MKPTNELPKAKPKQQLKAAAKLAATYPLFADQLAPELPALKKQVAEFGNHEPPAPAKFAVGDRVRYQYWYYRPDPSYTGTITGVWGSRNFHGVYSWHYYVQFDEGQLPACDWYWHTFPRKEDTLTLLPCLPPINPSGTTVPLA